MLKRKRLDTPHAPDGSGRDPKGRFTQGNRIGAIPKRATMSAVSYRLRRRLLRALDADNGALFDEIVEKLIADAKAGHRWARRLIFAYGIGTPPKTDTREREQLDIERDTLTLLAAARQGEGLIASASEPTPELCAIVGALARAGLTLEDIGPLVGLRPTTVSEWIARGLGAVEGGGKIDRADLPYVSLAHSIDSGRAIHHLLESLAGQVNHLADNAGEVFDPSDEFL